MSFSRTANVGVVLSGGGMRGAYEVGVIEGIARVLRLGAGDPPLFRILAGTSVGAINAAYLAAHAHYGNHRVNRLSEVWATLKLGDHLRLRAFGLMRWPAKLPTQLQRRIGFIPQRSSFLDTRGIERVVARSIPWKRLHHNVANGTVNALLIAALNVASGRTTIFAETSPTTHFQRTPDSRRVTKLAPIRIEHVLASAALPLLFPTIRIGDQYYCDGGLRFNTPISPAIRAGADKLVVISVRHQQTLGEATAAEQAVSPAGEELTPTFLVGKLLNALLLDPVMYDLQVLERLNQLVDVMHSGLASEARDKLDRLLLKGRGAPYRKLETLVFTPSEDLGLVAADYIKNQLRMDKLSPVARLLLERTTRGSAGREADWASYLLFDGGFATRLIALGVRDALAKDEAIIRFFRN